MLPCPFLGTLEGAVRALPLPLLGTLEGGSKGTPPPPFGNIGGGLRGRSPSPFWEHWRGAPRALPLPPFGNIGGGLRGRSPFPLLGTLEGGPRVPPSPPHETLRPLHTRHSVATSTPQLTTPHRVFITLVRAIIHSITDLEPTLTLLAIVAGELSLATCAGDDGHV